MSSVTTAKKWAFVLSFLIYLCCMFASGWMLMGAVLYKSAIWPGVIVGLVGVAAFATFIHLRVEIVRNLSEDQSDAGN